MFGFTLLRPRRLSLACLLLGSAGCITVQRTSWYESARIESWDSGADIVPGEGSVLVLERSSSVLLPAPDSGTDRRLLIELAPATLAAGARIDFPGPTARAVFVLREGLRWHRSVASGTAVVVDLGGEAVELSFEARCEELGWERSGRARFERVPVPSTND